MSRLPATNRTTAISRVQASSRYNKSGQDSIVWSGYTWSVRDGGVGGPGIGSWSNKNVWVTPNDSVKLRLTNPSGALPIGSEIVNTSVGLGYGTYTIVVDADLTQLQKNVVFGGLFPFSYGNPYIEFDVNEVSKWDGGYATTQLSHNVWYGTDPENPSRTAAIRSIKSNNLQTHRLIWSEGSAIFDSYVGNGTGGLNYFHTEVTSNIPTPTTEQVYINLWAYAEGAATSDDEIAGGTEITIRSFNFVSATAKDTYTTIAGADDGHVNNAASPVFNNDSAFTTIGKAGTSNPYSGFYRFDNLQIPVGATITSAKMTLTSTAALSGGTCNLTLGFCAEDDATAPTDVATYNAKTTGTTTAWDAVGAWASGESYETPDLAASLQPIIDRAGWVNGNAVCLLVQNNNSSNNAYRQSKTQEAGVNAPVLTVTWSAA